MSIALSASLLLPFLGTALGAGSVYLLHSPAHGSIKRILSGFSGGIMTAASVWSLLIPAMESAFFLRQFAFIPPVAGFWLGILFLLGTDALLPRLSSFMERKSTSLPTRSTTMLVLAVALHNIPEGMAVGIVCAGYMSGGTGIRLTEVVVLALGIAIQNCPEGAVISLPLRADGLSLHRSFFWGIFSAIVELLGAVLTILAAELFLPVMPLLLGFAAGAMMYVVAEELLPDAAGNGRTPTGTIFFSVGFTLMMALDVALG